MNKLIIALLALMFAACGNTDPLLPIVSSEPTDAVDAPEERDRRGPENDFLSPSDPSPAPTLPEEPEPPDSDFACESGQYLDEDGNCFWPDEIPDECETDQEIFLRTGVWQDIAADSVGPMVVLNAADGAYLYGYTWNGEPRFDPRTIGEGEASGIQAIGNGEFMVAYRDPQEGQQLLVFDGLGQGTAQPLSNLYGGVLAMDGRNLITQDIGGEACKELTLASVNSFDTVDDIQLLGWTFPRTDQGTIVAHELAVQDDVWAFDDWSVAHRSEEGNGNPLVRYQLTMRLYDHNLFSSLGIALYEEILPSATYRWARANAIVPLAEGFVVAWEKGTGGNGSESFLSFIHYDNSSIIVDFAGTSVGYVAVEDMAGGENGEWLAVIIDEGSKPQQIRLRRLIGQGVLLEDRLAAQVDEAHGVRLAHVAGRTALTWRSESEAGLVRLFIACE